MKKQLTIVVLILSTFLFGELGNFTIVNPDNSNVKISNNCFATQNNTLYFTYRQKNANTESIILSKSTDLGVNYTYKEVYTADELSEPNISFFNNKILINLFLPVEETILLIIHSSYTFSINSLA